tara:strand:+ start:6695 stop:7396 length:702 start_codon:yes stop_codon:yes gene_type:complete
MSLINKVASIIDNKAELEKLAYMPNRVSYNDDLAILNIDLKSIIPKPAKNNSPATVKELEAVSKATKNRTAKELDLVYTVDKDPVELFRKFLSTKSLEFPQLKFDMFMNVMEQYMYALKYYHNRARPEQIAPYYNIEIDVLYTETHHTPSYPSGHVVYSETAAYVASESFPEYRSNFFQLSKYCGLARILQGVHFASDNKASTTAVQKLYPLVSKYYEQKRTQENPLDITRTA